MRKFPFYLGIISSIAMLYFAFSSSLMAKSSSSQGVSNSQESQASRLEAMRKFARVLHIVEENSVDPLNYTEITEKAISGLMNALDPHSSYFTKSTYDNFKIQTDGEFGGLGITVGMRDGALTVISPIDGTPADKAGLKPSDIILKINNQSTIDMTIDDSVNLMRGKPGTEIELTIVRKSEPKPFKVKIVRDVIVIDSVYSKTIDDDILYIRVTSFDRKVTEDVQKAIKSKFFVKNEEGKMRRGIILDLRNNPGGLLDQAVGLVDLFIDKGLIVSQKGQKKHEDRYYEASISDTFRDIPLVVLVNYGSASASEIVSGALQDHKRAVIIGEKTFGKGSVQAIWPISNEEAIKLTIARYYLPSGRTIQAVGVTPDIEVVAGEVKKEEVNEFKIREAQLKKHLESELQKIEGDSKTTNTTQKEDTKNKKIITQEDIFKDSQLKSAIDILRAIIITKQGF
jgi:carboxyl-terminal processing protease